jgi:hypothetical protein
MLFSQAGGVYSLGQLLIAAIVAIKILLSFL